MDDTLQIIIKVNKNDDTIAVSKCIDPDFDLDVLTEGLASILILNGKFTERSPLKVLEAVHNKLQNAIKFHGSISKSG